MSGPSRVSGVRDSAVLAIGSLLSGLAAYGFIAVGTRTVGATAFASVSVLWTLWAMSAAVFTFPVQHWVIRSIEVDGGERRVRKGSVTLLAAAVATSGLLGALCWLLRDRLFVQDPVVFSALAAAIPIGSVFMGLNRGVLASRRRFRSTALAIAGENLIRFGGAFVVTTAAGLGMSLVAGFAIALLWPSSFSLEDTGSVSDPRSALRFVGGVAGGSLIGQVVLTSGPVVLALMAGAPGEITALFSALALFRAPYMLAIGVTPRLTARLTRIAIDRKDVGLRNLAMSTLIVGTLAAALAGLFGRWLGPELVQLVFGDAVRVDSGVAGVVAGASAVALSTLFLTLMMVAAARVAAVSTIWLVAAGLGVAALFLGTDAPIETVAYAFLISELAAFALMVIALVSRRLQGSALSTS